MSRNISEVTIILSILIEIYENYSSCMTDVIWFSRSWRDVWNIKENFDKSKASYGNTRIRKWKFRRTMEEK